MINDRKNKALDDFKNINERIKNNNKKIEEIKKSLLDLKEEKKQKEADIINLLSNKESIEEIYKNQIYSLNFPGEAHPRPRRPRSASATGTSRGRAEALTDVSS